MTRYATIPIVGAPSWDVLDSPIIEGDCLEVMRALPDCSVDAVVTDPPYGIGFMGHEWDQPGEFGPVRAGGGGRRGHRSNFGRHEGVEPGDAAKAAAVDAGRYDLSASANQRFQAWCEAWGREALRVLKPGGHAVVFGGPRTFHRLTCGLEDAGFEIRDTLMWLFGSGFPKSLDVSKAIDRAAGADREVVGHGRAGASSLERVRRVEQGYRPSLTNVDPGAYAVTVPSTDEARAWDGWGTALKPGYEPIVLARKPLAGTVAETVLAYGTGALNIAGCRIETDEALVTFDRVAGHRPRDQYRTGTGVNRREVQVPGRWPANVVLDEEAAALLDEQTGELRSGFMAAGTQREGLGYRGRLGTQVRNDTHGDSGGASRFFYTAKTSRWERNAGLEHLPQRVIGTWGGEEDDLSAGKRSTVPRGNSHPTVKPLRLMAWLLRLVTPPDGVVLDPFAGSGSTVCAGATEGIAVFGIERESAYVEIARARAAWWAEHPRALVDRPRQPRAVVPDPDRMPSLLDALDGEAA